MTLKEERARRRRRRRIQVICQRLVIMLLIVVIIVLAWDVLGSGKGSRTQDADGIEKSSTDALQADAEKPEETEDEEETEATTVIPVGDADFLSGYTAQETADTAEVTLESVISSNVILIDVGSGTIVAEKDAYTQISPASMTKILTILVAAELIEDWDATVEITQEMTDYAYVNDCSIVGFDVGEQVPVTDLFYGTILPSGADAAYALAVYTAGSHEAFVEKMNEKLAELGLSETTHFTNCVGLYDEDHYSTVYDMAMILKAAVENDFCREVLTAHTYTTTATEEHPDGITISNWFLRRIEDKETGGEVLCAKTGFVNQSGNCAASYMLSDDGVPYICVTAGSSSSWRCIYDHVDIYNTYIPD